MKILITGATGLIGKEIGKKLVQEGHQITVLTRSIEDAKSSLPFPATILLWSHFSDKIPAKYFDYIDIVIHLAGESIASGKWTENRKKEIYESRIIGTKNIVSAIELSNKTVKQFICASAIGIYGNTEETVNEDSTLASDFLASVCKDWEKEAQRLKDIGINVVNPRIGIVLSRNGGALEKMLPVFSLSLGGVLGDGKQWMSWIHLEDLVNMFVFFVKNQELSGAYNAVAPKPETNKDFSTILAKALGEKLSLPVPKIALKLLLGELSTLILDGQKVCSKKIVAQGFDFKFKNLDEALNDICMPLRNGTKEIFSEVWLPQKKHEVFSFFSDEKNLEKLTPDYLNFKVLNKSTNEMQEGTLIDYKLILHGIPLKWRTLIENWEPENKFVDTQINGPYKLWHHTHEFEDFAGGTLIRDRVKYQIPLGKMGEIFSSPFVKKDVQKIFSYRKKIIAKIFLDL